MKKIAVCSFAVACALPLFAKVELRYLFSRPWFGALYNDTCLPLAAFEIAK